MSATPSGTVLKMIPKQRGTVVRNLKGYWVDQPDGSRIWKRDRELVDVEAGATVYISHGFLEELMQRAFQNKNRQAVRGGIKVVLTSYAEIPNTRRQETV